MNSQATPVVTTYRFKLSHGITELIQQFSKIHQYDDTASYKEAWLEWLDLNDEEIIREQRRLEEEGYQGDIIKKMYKSGRYYYRTKSSEKSQPSKRREYVSLSKEFIDAINNHIKMHNQDKSLKPAVGFEDFCKTHVIELTSEIELIQSIAKLNVEDITEKFKKAYKNQYFQIIKKTNTFSA